MNSKAKIILIVFSCIIVMIVVSIVLINRVTKKNDEPQQAENDVLALNEKSYFYGYHLLDSPPEGYNASIANILPSKESIEDYYHCGRYHGNSGITHITLNSEQAHLFGIHVGDDGESVLAVMENEGYIKDREEDTIHVYVKNDITIRFRISSENVIREIAVAVVDYEEMQADY